MCDCSIAAHNKSGVGRKPCSRGRVDTVPAEMGLEVGYKGSSLRWCSLINHCPPPSVAGGGSFSLGSELSLLPHACGSSGVLEKKKKKENDICAFFGPTDMKSHRDIKEDVINLHGCPPPLNSWSLETCARFQPYTLVFQAARVCFLRWLHGSPEKTQKKN